MPAWQGSVIISRTSKMGALGNKQYYLFISFKTDVDSPMV